MGETSRVYIVNAPIVPPRALMPNVANEVASWRARVGMSKRKKKFRLDLYHIFTSEINAGRIDRIPNAKAVEIQITVYWGKGRKKSDADNVLAAFKSGIDGVADALEINDRKFSYPPVKQGRDSSGVGYTEFILTVENQP